MICREWARKNRKIPDENGEKRTKHGQEEYQDNCGRRLGGLQPDLARLSGLPTWERAEKIIDIAHPDFREELIAADNIPPFLPFRIMDISKALRYDLILQHLATRRDKHISRVVVPGKDFLEHPHDCGDLTSSMTSNIVSASLTPFNFRIGSFVASFNLYWLNKRVRI